jgi:hypothetical protein
MKTVRSIFVFCISGFWLTLSGLGDQVIMHNGDVYNGKVMDVTTNSLLLKSEILGSVTLPRSKVATINFGAANPSNPPAPSVQTRPVRPVTLTNSALEQSSSLRGIQADSNLVQQVQAQFLGSSSPEAMAKFNQMLDDLSSGKMDMNGLRTEAQSAADQLRAYGKELGPDAAGEVNDYLKILDQFLAETAPKNAPPAPPAKEAHGDVPKSNDVPQTKPGHSQ